jgi:hypothetical protein
MLLGTPLFLGGFRACNVLQVARETGWPPGLRTKLPPCGGRVGGSISYELLGIAASDKAACGWRDLGCVV